MSVRLEDPFIESVENSGDLLASSLMNFAPVPLAISRERDGLILQVNPRLVELTKTPAKDILGRSASIFYSRIADREEVLRQMREYGRVRDFEVELRRDDGTKFRAALSVEPFTIGQERCLFVTFDDVTERRRAEQILKESEARLKEAQQIAKMGSWVWDLETGKFEWSEEMYRIHAVTQEERGEDVWDLIQSRVHPDDVDRSTAVLQQAISSGTGFNFDGRILWPNGQVRSVYVKGEVHRDAAGTPVSMIGTTQDVTEQKLFAESRRREKELSERLINSSFDGILAFDRDVCYTVWNPAMERLTGLAAKEVLGKCAFDLFPFLKETGEDRYFLDALQGKTVMARDRSFVIPETGRKGFFEASYSPLRDNSGGIPGGLVVIRDITERKRADQALAESEAMFRALADKNPVMVAIYQDDRHVYVNRAAEPLTGYTHEELMEMPVGQLVHPDLREEVRLRGLARQRGEEVPARYEMHVLHKDGSDRWLDFSAAPIQFEGKPARIGMAVDITERKAAEQALRSSEERLELALWGTDLALWDWHLATDAVFVNEQWARILGCELDEIKPQFEEWKNSIHPQDIDRVFSLLRDYLAGKTSTFEAEYQFRAKSGRWKWIHTRGKIVERDAAGKPSRATGTHRDITDRKIAEIERAKLETEVQSDEKLKSLGLLAGGIAHDFNNLLMGVLGHAELARAAIGESSPAREHLATIETAAERAAELCHQLLAYSGRGRFVVERLDLNRAVLETAALLETTIPKKVVLQFELSESSPAIEADSPQIRRVIMNLITNAADAIGIAPGTVTVRSGVAPTVDDEEGTLFSDENIAEGPFAFVDVSDTGVGMNVETISKMFDPFFTSKFTGRGLGLAAVLGIVRGHRGAIRVKSAPGKGTLIRILFPVSQQLDAPAPVSTRPPTITRSSGTVLVVDDTEIVRTVARRTLEQAGYNVITANDGNEAIREFALHRNEIIAVLLDVTMPNLDGDQTFRELKRLEIEVPVLLTSGYDEQETASLFGADGPAGFLQKPFRPHVLIQKIQEVLRGP